MNVIKRHTIKWFCLVVIVLYCLMPLTSSAEESFATMPWIQLEREAREGILLPLNSLDSRLDAVVDGVVYGYGIKLFQTWFEVGDDSLFEVVGLSRPQGTITWSEFMNMAEAVEKYNQENEETVWLLATLNQRFPNTFPLMNQSDIQKQWEAIQSVVCLNESEMNNVLLKECVVSIERIGNRDYITSIQNGDRIYPLAEPEMRYVVIRRNDAIPDSLVSELMNIVKEASPVKTGIIPPDLSYEQFLKDWTLNIPAPSNTNFELWKQSKEFFGS